MSDASGLPDEQTPGQPYRSEFDSLFSDAWNEVYAEEDGESAGESGAAEGAAGEGAAAPAAPGEGAGAEAPATPAPTDGAGAGPLGELAGALQQLGSPPASGEQPGKPEDAGNSGQAGTAGAAAPAGVDVATITPLFEKANEAINTRMESTFKTRAEEEVRNEIDPDYFDVLEKHPFELVGQEVPSIRPGEKVFKPRDTKEAQDYLEATKILIDRQIAAKASARMDEVKPMMSVLQESSLMFQNNPDLVPGTLQFDKELADKFTKIAKPYQVEVNGKVYGYQVQVQPLINELRADLAKVRGVTSEQTEQKRREAAAAQAATQPRTPGGQFQAPEGPQGGIPSTATRSGKPSDDDDYNPFWEALGMGGLANM